MYSVLLKMQHANRAYTNHLQDILLPYGLSTTQWGMMRYLHENGPSTASDLVAYWQVEKPTVTPIAQKLYAQEIITVSPGTTDKRQKIMYLSEKGIQLFDEIEQILTSYQEQLLEGLTPEMLEEAEQFLDHVLTKCRKGR